MNIKKHRIWAKVVNLIILITFLSPSAPAYALSVRDCASYLRDTEHSIEDWKIVAIGIIKELEDGKKSPEDIEREFTEKFGSMLNGYGISEKIIFEIKITRDRDTDEINLKINGEDLQLVYKERRFTTKRDEDAALIRKYSPENILERIAGYKDDFIGNEIYGEYLIFLLELSIQISGREDERERFFAVLYERTDTPHTRIIHGLVGKIIHMAVSQYTPEVPEEEVGVESKVDYGAVIAEVQRRLRGSSEIPVVQGMAEERREGGLGIEVQITKTGATPEVRNEKLNELNGQLKDKLEHVRKVMNGLLIELKDVVSKHEEDGLIKTITLKIIDNSIKKMESTAEKVNTLILKGEEELKQGNKERAHNYYRKAKREIITALKQTQNAGKEGGTQLKQETMEILERIRSTARDLEGEVDSAFSEFFKEVFPAKTEEKTTSAGSPSEVLQGIDHKGVNAEIISRIEEALNSAENILETTYAFINKGVKRLGYSEIKILGLTISIDQILKKIEDKYLENKDEIEKTKEEAKRLIEIAEEELEKGDRKYAYMRYKQAEGLVLGVLSKLKGNISMSDFDLLNLVPAIKSHVERFEQELDGNIKTIEGVFEDFLNSIFTDIDNEERKRLEQELLTEEARIIREELKLPKAPIIDRILEQIGLFLTNIRTRREIKEYLNGREIIEQYESNGKIPLKLLRKSVFVPFIIRRLKREKDERRVQAYLWLLAKIRKELRDRIGIKYMLKALPFIKRIVKETRGRYSFETKIMALRVLMGIGNRKYFTGYKIKDKDIPEFLWEFASSEIYRLDERYRVRTKEYAMRMLFEIGDKGYIDKLYSLLESDNKAVRVVLLRAIKDYYVPESVFDKLVGFVLDEEEMMEIVRPALLIIREKAGEKGWEILFNEICKRDISEDRILFIVKGMYYEDPTKIESIRLPLIGVELPIRRIAREFTLRASVKPLMDILCSPSKKFTYKVKGELIEAILSELGPIMHMNEFFNLLYSIINKESTEYNELREEENRPVLRDVIGKVLQEKKFSERKADLTKGEDVPDIIEKLKLIFSQYKEEADIAVGILYTMGRLAYNHEMNIDDYIYNIYKGDYKEGIKETAVRCFSSPKLMEMFLNKDLELRHMGMVIEILEERDSKDEVNALLKDERFTNLHKVRDKTEKREWLGIKNSVISGIDKKRVNKHYSSSMQERADNKEEDFYIRANAYRRLDFKKMIDFVCEKLNDRNLKPEDFIKIITWVHGYIKSQSDFGHKDIGWYFQQMGDGDKEYVVNKFFDFVTGNLINILNNESSRENRQGLIRSFIKFFRGFGECTHYWKIPIKRPLDIIMNEKHHDDIREIGLAIAFGEESNIRKLFHASRNPPEDRSQLNYAYSDNEFVKEFLQIFVEDESIFEKEIRDEIKIITDEILTLLKTPNNPFIKDDEGNFRLIKVIKRLKEENKLRLVKVVLSIPGGIELFDEFSKDTDFIFRFCTVFDSLIEKHKKSNRPHISGKINYTVDMVIKEILIQYGKYNEGEKGLVMEALGKEFIFSLMFSRIMDFVRGYVKNKEAAMLAYKHNQISAGMIDSIITVLDINEELTKRGLDLGLYGDELISFVKEEISEDSALAKKKKTMEFWQEKNMEKTEEEERRDRNERYKLTERNVYGLISEDRLSYRTVKKIFENLKRGSSKSLGDIYLIDSPGVNAYVLHGDNDVYLYLGLLTELSRYARRHNFDLTEDMIAFVIAHEITHIEQGILPEDLPREIKEGRERLNSLVREMEYDADKGAIKKLMVRAGYNPREAVKSLSFLLAMHDQKISTSHPRDTLRTLEINELVEDPEEVMHTDRETKKIIDTETLKSIDTSEHHAFDSGFRAGSLEALMAMIEETDDVMFAADLLPQMEALTEYVIAKHESEEAYIREYLLKQVFIDNLKLLIAAIAGEGVGYREKLHDSVFDMMYYCDNQDINTECQIGRDIRNITEEGGIRVSAAVSYRSDLTDKISQIRQNLDASIKKIGDQGKKAQLVFLDGLLLQLLSGNITFTRDDLEKAIAARPIKEEDMARRAIGEIDNGNESGCIEILKTNLTQILSNFTARPHYLRRVAEWHVDRLSYEARREMGNMPINVEDFSERFYAYDNRNPDFSKAENRRKVVETLLIRKVYNTLQEIKKGKTPVQGKEVDRGTINGIWEGKVTDALISKLRRRYPSADGYALHTVIFSLLPYWTSNYYLSPKQIEQLFEIVTDMDYLKRYYISPVMRKEGIVQKSMEDVRNKKKQLLGDIANVLGNTDPQDTEAFKKYENQVITAIERWGRYIESSSDDIDKVDFLDKLFLKYLELAQKRGKPLMDVLPIIDKYITETKIPRGEEKWQEIIGIAAYWPNTPAQIRIIALDSLVPRKYVYKCGSTLVSVYFSMSPRERELLEPNVHFSFLKKIASISMHDIWLSDNAVINIEELYGYEKYIDDKLVYFFKREALAQGRKFSGDAFVDALIEYYKLKAFSMDIKEKGSTLINSSECFTLLMELNSNQLGRLIREMKKIRKPKKYSESSKEDKFINTLFILKSIREKHPGYFKIIDLSDLQCTLRFLIGRKIGIGELVQILEGSLFEYYDIDMFQELSSDISRFGHLLEPMKRGSEYKSQINPPESPYPDFTTAVNTKDENRSEKTRLLEEYMGTKKWRKKGTVEKAEYIVKALPEKCLYKDLLLDELEEEIFPSLKGKRTMIERRDALDLDDIRTRKQAKDASEFYKRVASGISNDERRIRYASTAHRIYLEKLDGEKEGFEPELNLILEFYTYADYERDDVLTDLIERKGKVPEDMIKAEGFYSVNQKRDYTAETLDKSSIFERAKEVIEQAKRSERVELLLWLGGIRKEHPTHIAKMLPSMGMDFGSMRKIIAEMSPSSRKRIYMRILRGENGVFEPSIEHALLFIRGKISEGEAAGSDYGFSSDSEDNAEIMLYFLDRVFDSLIDEEATKSLGDTEEERAQARKKLRTTFLAIFAAYSPARRMDIYLHLLDLHNKIKDAPLGKKLATVLTAMGAAGVKVGQYLSEQEDLIRDEEIRKELAYLKGEVEPLKKRGVLKVIRDSGLETKLRAINGAAGTASIKQVQIGIYEDGTEVIIGVVKPSVMKYHPEDMFVVGVVSDILNVFYDIKLPKIKETVNEQIIRESNLEIEARNQEAIRQAGYSEPNRYRSSGEGKYGLSIEVPRVFAYSRSVIVSERVKGLTLTQRETLIEGRGLIKKYGSIDAVLTAKGKEKAKTAEKSIKIEGLLREMGYRNKDIERITSFNEKQIYEVLIEHLFHQLFSADIYHADLHKSNIMITPSGKIYLIDFGIIGELKSEEKKAGIGILSSVFTGNDNLLIKAVEKFIGVEFAEQKRTMIRDKLRETEGLEISEQISAKLKILLDFVDEIAIDRQKKYRFDTFVTAISRSSYLIRGAFGRFQGLLGEYGGVEASSVTSGSYFGESRDKRIKKKIDREIKDIAEDVKKSRFLIVRQGKGNPGWYKMEKVERIYDRNVTGNFREADQYTDVVNNVVDMIIEEYPELAGYDVWILKTDISGHSGASRKRIYIPIDILKMAEANQDVREELIADHIKHEYLESLRNEQGKPLYSHEEVVSMLGKEFHKRVHKMYRGYIINELIEEVKNKEGLGELRKELNRILKMVQEQEEITLEDIDPKELFLIILKSRNPELEQKVCRLLNLILGKDYKYRRGKIAARIYYTLSRFRSKKAAVAPSSGEMKGIGRRDTNGKDNEASFTEAEMRAIVSSAEPSTRSVYTLRDGRTAHIIMANADKMKGLVSHHFGLDGEIYIVINMDKGKIIQEEGGFHEAQEIYWMGRISRGELDIEGIQIDKKQVTVQHAAHIIASAEQIQKYAIAKGFELTPYHMEQLRGMNESQIREIQSEGERNRMGHHMILEFASVKGAEYDIEKIKEYEMKFRFMPLGEWILNFIAGDVIDNVKLDTEHKRALLDREKSADKLSEALSRINARLWFIKDAVRDEVFRLICIRMVSLSGCPQQIAERIYERKLTPDKDKLRSLLNLIEKQTRRILFGIGPEKASLLSSLKDIVRVVHTQARQVTIRCPEENRDNAINMTLESMGLHDLFGASASDTALIREVTRRVTDSLLPDILGNRRMAMFDRIKKMADEFGFINVQLAPSTTRNSNKIIDVRFSQRSYTTRDGKTGLKWQLEEAGRLNVFAHALEKLAALEDAFGEKFVNGFICNIIASEKTRVDFVDRFMDDKKTECFGIETIFTYLTLYPYIRHTMQNRESLEKEINYDKGWLSVAAQYFWVAHLYGALDNSDAAAMDKERFAKMVREKNREKILGDLLLFYRLQIFKAPKGTNLAEIANFITDCMLNEAWEMHRRFFAGTKDSGEERGQEGSPRREKAGTLNDLAIDEEKFLAVSRTDIGDLPIEDIVESAV